MAQVNLVEIVEHLRLEFERALADVISNCGESPDTRERYKELVKSLNRRTGWENVPPRTVKP